MNKSFKWLAGLLLALFAVYAFNAAANQPVVINYRLTLTADTPDGPKTGSGVIQVSYGSRFNPNGGGRRYDIELEGEAVTLDLGKGKYLFVTLTRRASGRDEGDPYSLETAQDAEWLPLRALGIGWAAGHEDKLAEKLDNARTMGPKPVPLSALPTLVTFRKPGDPMSVVVLHPDKISDAYGEGYSIRSAMIELTNDRITTGIVELLPWIPERRGGGLDGSNTMSANAPNFAANWLGAGDFKSFY